MALNDTVLTNLIKTKIEGKGLTVIDTNTINAIASAVVEHIKNAGVVNVTVAVTSGSSAGSYTGTGTVS